MYYKVIQNNYVTDAGSAFAKWNQKHRAVFICDVNEAEFALADSDKIYRDQWLKSSPADAEDAEIVIIEKDEYDELRQKLNSEETIEVYREEPEAEAEAPEIEPEILSVNEMRQMIIDQQEQIRMLTDTVQAILAEKGNNE